MQPQSPNANFDFMLKDSRPAKRGLPMPNFSRPVKIVLGVIIAIVLLIVISSVLSGRNAGKTQPFINVLARGQETLRITAEVQQLQLQDPQTQALAATVSSSLSSDKQQISSYLAKNHTKASAGQLNADVDKSTDAGLQAASQNNALDAAYVNYLKGALAKYQADLQNADKTAGPNGQKLLSSSLESTRTLLGSAPIKS